MVGFHKKFLAAKIPCKRVHGMVYCISFPLVGVPLLGRTGKPLGAESYGLVFDRSVRVGCDLEKDCSDCMLAGVAADYPRQVVPGKVKPTSLFDTFLELGEVFPVIIFPSTGIPRESIVCHLVELGRPFRVVRNVVVEEKCRSQKRLHFLLGLRERERINRLFAGFGKFSRSFLDFITKEGDFVVTDEGFLDLEHYSEFAAASDNPFQFSGRILEIVGKDQEIVEYYDCPVGEVFEIENLFDYGLEDAGGRSDTFR